MTSHCQCMTPLRLIAAKRILHALHNLPARKKKKENRCCCKAYSKVVTFHTITRVVFSLSTLYFKLNIVGDELLLNFGAKFQR